MSAITDRNNLLLALAAVKAEEKRLAEKKTEIEAKLVEALIVAKQKTISVTLDDGKTIKGTLVEAQRVLYDGDKLEKTLGAPMWKKVTKQVLDAVKLEAQITVGAIDPNVVAACSEVKDNKPYIRLGGDTLEAKQATALVTHLDLVAKTAVRVVRKKKVR